MIAILLIALTTINWSSRARKSTIHRPPFTCFTSGINISIIFYKQRSQAPCSEEDPDLRVFPPKLRAWAEWQQQRVGAHFAAVLTVRATAPVLVREHFELVLIFPALAATHRSILVIDLRVHIGLGIERRETSQGCCRLQRDGTVTLYDPNDRYRLIEFGSDNDRRLAHIGAPYRPMDRITV